MKELEKNICIPVTDKVINSLGMRLIPLPKTCSKEELEKQFLQAPQFNNISLEDSLRRRHGELRVILVGNQDYYMEQCAMYLSEMASSSVIQEESEDDRWLALDYNEEDDDDDEEQEEDEVNSIVVVSSSLINPPAGKTPMEMTPSVDLSAVPYAAVYVKAEKKEVIGTHVTDEMVHCFKDKKHPHLFLAVRPDQLDRLLSQHLQLRHGFVVCHVGAPTEEYLEEVFWSYGEKYYPQLQENPNVNAKEILRYLQHLRGTAFTQEDLESAVITSFPVGKKAAELSTQDFCFVPTPLSQQKSARESLEKMVELEEVKSVVSRILAMDRLNLLHRDKGREVSPRHRHMAFSGPPGTGKTQCAKLLAQLLQEEGEGSGLFVEAGREDMIAGYLGQTAPKIASLFEKAQGGVLFLDEIGALTPGNSNDIYTEEAINALVYHMDRNPETIVIFATYPDEMDTFLNSNPGLKSRVAQNINFPSYDVKCLLEMLSILCESQGYGIQKKALEACGEYLQKLKTQNPRCFGNGREVRRLFNAAEEELALRITKGKAFTLTLSDVTQAIARLEPKNHQIKRTIGFAV